MTSKDTFDVSIKEVELINSGVDDKSNDCLTYYKAIILFLCTKLEKFVADSAKEYIIEFKNKHIFSKNIPIGLKEIIIQNELEKINKNGTRNYINSSSYNNGAINFSLIWNNDYVITNLNESDFYIELSSHGTTVIKDLYKKIGFSTLVEEITNYEVEEKVSGFTTTVSYSIVDVLNKIVGMRNRIIHEDANPSVTKQDIELYINVSRHFVHSVDSFLENEIRNLHN